MRLLQAWVLSVALATITSGCGGDSSATPPGPALGNGPTLSSNRLVFNSNRAGGEHEIYVMNTDGSSPTRLTHDAAYSNWWPRISPDRRKILFYRAPSGQHENYTQASLWVMNTDGTALTRLRPRGQDGWTFQGHAEWSPDGSQIAMAGSATFNGQPALEIFVTDASGQNAVRYTLRGGINTDVSWSPDGQQLLFNGCASPNACQPANYEIFVMNAVPQAPAVQVTNDNLADYDPYFSPDGTRIAWLVNVDPAANPIGNTSAGRWAIRMAVIGQPAAYLIDDGNINSKPSWSLDSQAIYFHRGTAPDFRFRVFRVNVSGAPNLTELTPGNTGVSEYPAN